MIFTESEGKFYRMLQPEEIIEITDKISYLIEEESLNRMILRPVTESHNHSIGFRADSYSRNHYFWRETSIDQIQKVLMEKNPLMEKQIDKDFHFGS